MGSTVGEENCNSSDHYSKLEEYEILKAAVEQINIQVFVYDVLLRRIYFFSNPSSDLFGGLNEGKYTVDELIRSGMIDTEYVGAFRNLFEDIERGARVAEARIRFCGKTGCFWNQVVLASCFDGMHSAVRAIGTMQNISGRAEVEHQYREEQRYRLAMLADFHRIYEINVTKDRFIKLESIQDSTDYNTWDTYTKSMNLLRETRVYREDWDVFLNVASRDRLLQGFQDGQTEFYCEYRIVDDEGNVAWSSSATHLLKDPISDDIKGFIYVKDIDAQKKRELELAHQAESDPLTGIYNRRTAERLISELLAEGEEKRYAFLTIDMDDFKYVNDRYGHIQGDILLKKVAQKINAILTDRDIFARLGGDEFILFLYIGEEQERLGRIAGLIVRIIKGIRVEEDSFCSSASVGVSVYPEGGTTFDALYESSDKALYQAKQCGKSCVEIYRSE